MCRSSGQSGNPCVRGEGQRLSDTGAICMPASASYIETAADLLVEVTHDWMTPGRRLRCKQCRRRRTVQAFNANQCFHDIGIAILAPNLGHG